VRTDHVLTFQLQQPQSRFQNSAEINLYNQRILSAVRSVSEVSNAAAMEDSDDLPLNSRAVWLPRKSLPEER
jgi:hypothetical protein